MTNDEVWTEADTDELGSGEVDVEQLSQAEIAAVELTRAYLQKLDKNLARLSLKEVRFMSQTGTPVVFMSIFPLKTMMELICELGKPDADEVVRWINALPEAQEALEQLGIKLDVLTHWADEKQTPHGISVYC